MLMRLELEILESITRDGPERPQAYVAWEDDEGEIQMGPCRYSYADGRYSCSPFPGAWVMVPLDRIRRVRHLQAMGLGPLPAWDRPCSVCGQLAHK